jgi:hypothetical protein
MWLLAVVAFAVLLGRLSIFIWRSKPMSTDTEERIVQHRTPLPEIIIPGDVLMQRALFARDVLGVHERTVARMDLPSTYISGITYVARDASLKIIADKVRRRNQQPKKRRASVA